MVLYTGSLGGADARRAAVAGTALVLGRAARKLTGKRQHVETQMKDAATTRLSSKGQVVIPEEIRHRLGLDPGARFVVVGDGDVVILKVIRTPEMSEFDELVGRARKAAKRAGRRKRDVNDVIRAVRDRR